MVRLPISRKVLGRYTLRLIVNLDKFSYREKTQVFNALILNALLDKLKVRINIRQCLMNYV